MRRHWKKRAQVQFFTLGSAYSLPSTDNDLGSINLGPVSGIYAGSVIANQPFQRCVVGDLGFRSSAVITGYSEGIALERKGMEDLWIPRAAIKEVRWGAALAGKIPPGGVLIIRHNLTQGGEVETGFRADPATSPARYQAWIDTFNPSQSSSSTAEINNSSARELPSEKQSLYLEGER